MSLISTLQLKGLVHLISIAYDEVRINIPQGLASPSSVFNVHISATPLYAGSIPSAFPRELRAEG